jgi:putative NADPH-quinone reductase
MNVLLIRANPRKTGYTQRLIELFRQGLRETRAVITDVDLTEQNIQLCLGCYHCWVITPGQCVHSDDMSTLLERMLEADVIVCATPLYYYSMSSCLKVFFERTLPLTQEGLQPSARGLVRNNTRYPERWRGKRLITIITGAFKNLEVLRPANETFQLIADGLDLEMGGQLTRPESYLLDYPLSKPKTLKRIQHAFIQAGREAGATGRLSPETMKAASLPLAVDLEHFRAYSNIYWAQARRMGAEGQVPASVQARVSGDVRILMREMVRCLDARATARVKAVLQFEFPDRKLVCHVRVDCGKCELKEGPAAKPDLLVRCDANVWAGIFTRQTDLRDVLKNRQLVLQGDKSLFSRLDRFFPPPSA